MRLQREDGSSIGEGVWVILGESEAFELMRDLGGYFAAQTDRRGWHTHVVGEGVELTVAIEAENELPTGPAPFTSIESSATQERFAESLVSADEHFDALERDDPVLRAIVLRRLRIRERDDARTFPALLTALKSDPTSAVRRAAAVQLADYGATEAVVRALREVQALDLDPEVRWEASEILIRYLGQPFP